MHICIHIRIYYSYAELVRCQWNCHLDMCFISKVVVFVDDMGLGCEQLANTINIAVEHIHHSCAPWQCTKVCIPTTTSSLSSPAPSTANGSVHTLLSIA